MHSNPLDAYQNVEKNSLEGRALEAFVLTKAANFLPSVQNGWDAQDRKEQLDEALRYNLRIWSLLQAEMTKSGISRNICAGLRSDAAQTA